MRAGHTELRHRVAPPLARWAASTGDATLRELVVTLVVFGLTSVVVLWPHLRYGGAYLDDWWLAAYATFPGSIPHDNGFEAILDYAGGRPGAVLVWLGAFSLAGAQLWVLRAVTIGLGVLAAVALHAALRALGLPAFLALGSASLALLSPAADSARFWPTLAASQVAILLYLVGLVLAVRAFRAGAPPSLHVWSCAAYVGSVLVTETMAPTIVVSLLAYLLVTRPGHALRRSAIDVAIATGGALLALALMPPRRSVAGPSDLLSRAGELIHDGLALGGALGNPFFGLHTVVALTIVMAAGSACAIHSRRGGERTPKALVALGVSTIYVAAAYSIYMVGAPTGAPLTPISGGPENRINVVAALPLAVAVVASLWVIATAAGTLSRRPRVGNALLVVLVLTTLGGYVRVLRADQAVWVTAAHHQREVVDLIRADVRARDGDVAFLVHGELPAVRRTVDLGRIGRVTNVPVFTTWWESIGATRLVFDNARTEAYVASSAQFLCGVGHGHYVGFDRVQTSISFERLVFVDMSNGTTEPARDRTGCVDYAKKLERGRP